MIAEDSVHLSSRAEDICFSSALELRKLSVEMAGRTKRQLDIVSRSLEPSVYDTQDFLDVAKSLALSGRGRIRILVLEPAALISRGGHRLVDLTMRLSSFMEIRSPGPDQPEFSEAMLIADRLGVIHQKYADRYEGIANFHAPRRAVQLAESFEALWRHAEPVPYFRRLML